MQNEIKTLLDISKDDMEKVNDIIIDNMRSDVPLIPQLAGYLINAGGKRIRPMLLCVVAGLLNNKSDKAPLFAGCVEFIHTATLLHDDVIDESDMRRGKETANNVWGNQATVLVGDFLFSRAFQLMAGSNQTDATQELANASSRLAEGEIMQLLTTNNLKTTTDEYIEMIGAKTAVLFSASCKVGAILAGADKTTQEKLYKFGENLGIAFQMIDDALDYADDNDQMDKNIGDDFKEGKITMPLLKVLNDGDTQVKEFLTRTIEKMEQTEDDLQTMLSYIKKYDAIKYTLDSAIKYGELAKEQLNDLPDGNHKTALIEAVDYAVKRAY
ncbi:MAG: polyprenyl synthetase family protein [Alphaproteobacteria bacterium]